MRFTLRIFFIATILGLFFSGCSSTPSPSDGQTILENKINSESEGNIKLVKFEKTDGQESETMGVKMYVMMFQGEIEFTSDLFWNPGSRPVYNSHEDFYEKYIGLESKIFVVHKGRGYSQNLTKGQHRNISGKIYFEKTENGWHGSLRSLRIQKLE